MVSSLAWLSAFGVMYVVKRFIFPTREAAVQQPMLERSIDFDCTPQSIEPIITTITTPLADWLFSTHGASLEQMVYRRELQGNVLTMSVFPTLQKHEREKRSFLVALPAKTPYYYELRNKQEDDYKAVITYGAPSSIGDIEKEFTVYKHSFQLDLTIRIRTKNDAPYSLRLFYGAPMVKELSGDDQIQAVIRDPQDSLKKIPRSSLTANESWHPALFGTEDKFFLNVLYQDSNAFVHHAFFHLIGNKEMFAVLQGSETVNASEWHLNFYVGPKEEKQLIAVDKQLDQVLEYSGILAPLSKLLMKILNWLYQYLHNYGWAIIVLTLAINLVLLPFNIKSLKNMKKASELSKKLDYVKQRYKNEPEVLQREQSDLIAKHGSSLLGGCLPKLLQFPIFFALSRVLTNSVQLYKAPFMGWIQDLSAPDPYYILPLLVFIAIAAQSTTGTDVKQRFAMLAMALLVSSAMTGFAAGVCLYVLVGLLLNFVQTFFTQTLHMV